MTRARFVPGKAGVSGQRLTAVGTFVIDSSPPWPDTPPFRRGTWQKRLGGGLQVSNHYPQRGPASDTLKERESLLNI